MKKLTLRKLGFGLLTAAWLGLAAAAWFLPSQELSESERRKLAQFPSLSAESLLSGRFMEKFETYTQDQFPFRDAMRTTKSLFHFHILHQKDNHGIYLADGYAAKLEYPLSNTSVQYAADQFNRLRNTCFPSQRNVFFAIVPDKGYYLAPAHGYPAMDYDTLTDMLQTQLPWAQFIDLTDSLSVDSYYHTDTHWRQEQLLTAAKKLASAMDVTVFDDLTPTALERPFYGVYYGQAALPMEPDTIYLMENDRLWQCAVSNYETGNITTVYDMDKLDSKDLYDVYLSGAAALLTIDNPNANTNRELIVFRDSFGSSIVPLLLQDYSRVTLVDIRYVASSYLPKLLDFHGQDILFLYSTLVLNNSSTLK